MQEQTPAERAAHTPGPSTEATEKPKYEYEIKLSATVDDCAECGAPGNTVTLAELEEGIKALDIAIRMRRRAELAGQNIDTKLRIIAEIKQIEAARRAAWAEYRQLEAFGGVK